MGETSHEQNQSRDAASKRPFNKVMTDAKDDAEHAVATGIDSIQAGTRVPPASDRHESAGKGAEAQAKDVNSTGQDKEAGEKAASEQPRASSTEPTEANSDNNGPVRDGDTAG